MRVLNTYKTRIPTLKEALDDLDDIETADAVETELPADDTVEEVPAEEPIEEPVEEVPAEDPVPELTAEEIDVLKKVLAAYEGGETAEGEVCPECGEAECICGEDDGAYEGEVIDDDLGDTVELVAAEDLPEPDEESETPYY